MKKLNKHFSSTVLLGVVASSTLAITPVQAQTIAPPPFRGPGAAESLANCPGDLVFPQKCDPNADVVISTPNRDTAGLRGSVNFIPLAEEGGLRLQPTGLTTPDGLPLTNIDFVPPDRSGEGSLFVVNTGSGSDFEPFQEWVGTIKDLFIPGSTGDVSGRPFPNPNAPRVRDANRITQPPTGGSSTVMVNGIEASGFTMDLNFVGFPVHTTLEESTTIALGVELQGYLLDPSGRRIEEQFPLPNTLTSVFANKVEGAFTATFPNVVDGIPLEERLMEGAPLTGFGFDATLDSTPIERVIPEPTTILSSLLLFGGGAFKLSQRKRS